MLKMILAVIPHDHADSVLNALIQANHTATFTDSRGGMLRQAQRMLFIAVDTDELESTLAIIRENCRAQAAEDNAEPVTTALGGAVVFVWDIERFETY